MRHELFPWPNSSIVVQYIPTLGWLSRRWDARRDGLIKRPAALAEDLKPLWDAGFGLCPQWAPPTIADGKVFVVTGGENGNLGAYRLGGAAHDTSWTTLQPAV